MKAILPVLGLLGCTLFLSFCTQIKEDPEKTTEFLTEMADARMMDREEGRLAAEKGTTEAIRQYGKLMVKDQTFLLEEMQKLAAVKNVALPTQITEKKAKALEKLKMKAGKDFDRKFLSMIKIDHKRDVRKFKDASQFEDAAVRAFASKHLPMIESHLAEVKTIRKNS